MSNKIQALIKSHENNPALGIYSVCSSNPFVLEAAMLQAKQDKSLLLVESTSNQVDQFGGYTGMTPKQFIGYIKQIAGKMGFSFENIILGGDHLGPNRWQDEVSGIAMDKSKELIKQYVEAGFSKIHLDTSMKCADDTKDKPLDDEIVAERSAVLCSIAEDTVKSQGFPEDKFPVYVIGTEVPVPGGAQEQLDTLKITATSDVERTIQTTKSAFLAKGLHDAWERVIAVVVQPGVEFDDHNVIDFQHQKAKGLSTFIEQYDQLVYEAHSTDYQAREALKNLVHAHFMILKVGPWLTYALREALFALARIEDEYLAGTKSVNVSELENILEREMIKNSVYWQKYYKGNSFEQQLARKYSFSDRARYYWTNEQLTNAVQKLISNLNNYPVPLTLLSQFMPNQYNAIREKRITNDPVSLIHHKIMEVTGIYAYACSIN